MASHGRGVDAVIAIVRHDFGQRRCDRLPGAVRTPATEASRDRIPTAVTLGHVPPRHPGAQAPQNAVDRGPPIPRRPAAPAALRRKKLLQQTPFGVAQISSAQGCLPRIYSLESKPESCVKLFVHRTWDVLGHRFTSLATLHAVRGCAPVRDRAQGRAAVVGPLAAKRRQSRSCACVLNPPHVLRRMGNP